VYLPAVLAALEQTSVESIVVVSGAHPLPRTTVLGGKAREVRAADWERGPGASLRAGLTALEPEIETALVVLADGPELDPRAIERILAHRRDGDVVAASYDGARSHPVALARIVWDQIPNEGARALQPLLVACDDLTPPGDVDFRR